MRRALLLFVVAALWSAPADAQAYSCRGYPSAVIVSQIKNRVEALRRIEREAADRLSGLDTRPYEWLLEQARASEVAIAVPALLEAEDALMKCRNFILPVRMMSAFGAAALVRLIGEIVTGEATSEIKMAYAQTVAHY